MPCFIAALEEKVAEGVSIAEALGKTLNVEASEHSTPQAIVTSVCDVLGARDSRPGSSLRGHVEALYTRVGERLKDALHIGMKRTLAVVSSHYLGIDLSAVSEGYVVGDDEDEAREEIQKLADTAEGPRDALASLFESEVALPTLNPPRPREAGP
jgi:hypothetical protein